ncbi:MAG: phage holin family protein [Gemmatimonadetes bacterium]|nr:phage holin family protein [Gemmatimonadota bacterium]
MEFMIGLAVTTLVSAGVLFVASKVVRGIDIDNGAAAVMSALVLGMVNWAMWTFLAPILLPLTMLTLGLFAIVVNAVALKATAAMVRGFEIRGFGAALAGALTIAVINLVIGFLFGM